MSPGGGSYVALAAGETEPVSYAVPHLLGGLMQDSAKDPLDSYRGLPAYPPLLLPRKPLWVRVGAEPSLRPCPIRTSA